MILYWRNKVLKAKRMKVKKIKLDTDNLWLAGRNEKLRIALDLYNKQRTNVIIHGSAPEQVPLDPMCGVKSAFSPTNEFIKAMRENAEK